jgi:glucosamine--fructose-6-phosphate aminotransferase (isomerizing)
MTDVNAMADSYGMPTFAVVARILNRTGDMTSQMRAETLVIPEVVATALGRQGDTVEEVARRIRDVAPRGFVTVARGTSDHAAEYAIRLGGRELGLLGASLSPSLVTLAEAPLRFDRQLVVGISQSGRSPDVGGSLAAARRGGALTLAVVNEVESPLAETAELVLRVDAGAELAVAATKSYVASLVQIARLTAALSGRDAIVRAFAGLPAALERALAVDWSAALADLEVAPSLLVVGRGLAYATAREAALKLKEVCGLHAEAVSGAEVMHGPKALIDGETPLLMFTAADVPAATQVATARELAALTRRLWVAGGVDTGVGHRLTAPLAGEPALQPLVDIVPLYLLADELARRRGLSPDRPRHLTKVTETR